MKPQKRSDYLWIIAVVSISLLFLVSYSLIAYSEDNSGNGGEDSGNGAADKTEPEDPAELSEDEIKEKEEVEEKVKGSRFNIRERSINVENVEEFELGSDYIKEKNIREIVTREGKNVDLESIYERLKHIQITDGSIEIFLNPLDREERPRTDDPEEEDFIPDEEDYSGDFEITIGDETYTFSSEEGGSIKIQKDDVSEESVLVLSEGVTLKLEGGGQITSLKDGTEVRVKGDNEIELKGDAVVSEGVTLLLSDDRQITSLRDGTEIRIIGESELDLRGEALVEYTDAYAKNPLKVNLVGEGSSLHLQTAEKERYVFKSIDDEKGLEVTIGSYHSTEDCIGNCASYMVEQPGVWDKIKIDGDAILEKHYNEKGYSTDPDSGVIVYMARFEDGKIKMATEPALALAEIIGKDENFGYYQKTVLNYNNEVGIGLETDGSITYNEQDSRIDLQVPYSEIDVQISDLPTEKANQAFLDQQEKEEEAVPEETVPLEPTGWIQGLEGWKHMIDEDGNIIVMTPVGDDEKYHYEYRGEKDGMRYYEAFESGKTMGLFFNEEGQQVDANGNPIGDRKSTILGDLIKVSDKPVETGPYAAPEDLPWIKDPKPIHNQVRNIYGVENNLGMPKINLDNLAGSGVDGESLIMALIHRESKFDPYDRHGDSVGLTQLPASTIEDFEKWPLITSTGIGREYGPIWQNLLRETGNIESRLINDYDFSVMAGVSYLKMLEDRYLSPNYEFGKNADGSPRTWFDYSHYEGDKIDLVLFAYNAGPGATKALMESFPGGDWNDLKTFVHTQEAANIMDRVYRGTVNVPLKQAILAGGQYGDRNHVSYVEEIKHNAGLS